ncbi:riboflavin synthase subunit beta, partial [human gut metagenome]
MATAYHNLSDYDFSSVPSAEKMKFGIVVSEWNYNITGALLKGAIDTLKKHGAKDENILVKTVPGSFELTFGANQLIEYSEVDAVIAIGCVVRGDTPHFDYVCMGATQGITQLNASGDVPVIYGLITTNTMEQAEDRAGGKLGNKGDECAITAIKMIDSNGELADPAECKQIADLGVDFLACGIGNIHGVYPADWAGLSFERLGEIKAETGDLPL